MKALLRLPCSVRELLASLDLELYGGALCEMGTPTCLADLKYLDEEVLKSDMPTLKAIDRPTAPAGRHRGSAQGVIPITHLVQCYTCSCTDEARHAVEGGWPLPPSSERRGPAPNRTRARARFV